MNSGAAWSAIGVDEVELIDWRRTGISWRPIRQALKVEIVGMAAFTAREAGEVVIEPHTETGDGRGQQEVYIVMRGRVLFTIDGEQVTALPGTLIRVDPQAHRKAVALDPDTAVLALGGESVFTPSGSEWIERARPHIRSAPTRAREIIDDLRAQRPGDRAGDVGEALLAVGSGEISRAHEIVHKLVADGPEIRPALEADPDLADLLPESPGSL